MPCSTFVPAILTDHGTVASRTLGKPTGTSYEVAHTDPNAFRVRAETEGDNSEMLSTTLG
jgi:hypothetical protein